MNCPDVGAGIVYADRSPLSRISIPILIAGDQEGTQGDKFYKGGAEMSDKRKGFIHASGKTLSD
jgi:hypothetical protein